VAVTGRQTLIFDADDTLWENNVVFERVARDFVTWVDHPTLTAPEVRAALDAVEETNIAAHGYGSAVFLRSLGDAYTQLTGRAIGAAERERLDGFETVFTSGLVKLIDPVETVLADLGGRHDLLLMTKGAREEQQRKIDSSGLAGHFGVIEIVPVKDEATYRRVTTDHGLDPERTWMIGNSPRSDIVAARQAGLHAVFIPNENTWAHEFAELDPADARILQLASLRELPLHF
jgi:putative hydrolase of the HAD superfamily